MSRISIKEEFINKLDENEQLLFYGFSNVSKTSKQYGRYILGFVVVALFWTLEIIGIKNEGRINFDVVLIIIVLCVLTLGLIYGFVHNVLLKYKSNNNEYFVTNKRIATYSSKSGFKTKKISDIECVQILREKNNYGDIILNFSADSLIQKMKNVMSLEGVENPRKIVELISNINKNIPIYDDRPTIMGKKI